MAQVQPKTHNWWYDRLCDWMLLNPDRLLGEAAKEFGVTQSWLSVIKNSDSFKAYYAERSAAYSKELQSSTVATLIGVKEKTAAAAETALDEIQTRLEKMGAVMPFSQLLDIAKLNLATSGYVGPKGPAQQVTVNIGVVGRDELEKAREKMRQVGGAAPSALPGASAMRSLSLVPANIAAQGVPQVLELEAESTPGAA